MAPQPYTVNGRLTLFIQVAGLDHKNRYPVRLVTPVSTPFPIVQGWPGTGTQTPQQVADQIWGDLLPLYNSATPAPTFLLEENVSGTFVPLLGGTAAGGAGTNTAFNESCGQSTLTFKGVNNHKLKILLMESALRPPAKFTIPSGNPAIDALPNDMLLSSSPSSLNQVITTRGGEQLQRIVGYVVTLNRELRKARSLV